MPQPLNNTTKDPSRDLERILLKFGIPFSLIIHLVLMKTLFFTRQPEEIPDLTNVTYVTLEPPAPPKSEKAPPKQIVSSPETTEKASPQEPNRLSDKDTSVAKEQVRRGADANAGPAVGKQTEAKLSQPQKEKPSQEKQPSPNKETSKKAVASKEKPTQESQARLSQPSAPPKLRQLLLDETTLQQEFSRPSKAPSSPRPKDLSSYRAFSRPLGSGAQFLGLQGTTDYLPNLPDGDITLLNAKADQFAVFVRRVATRVFSALRSSGWESLSANDVLSLKDFATVKAVLSPSGVLLSVTLDSTSGSRRFDEVLASATRTGARDPHPPVEAAASDGNIRFIFKARSWVEGGVNRRTGAPLERRWLLLATGLE